jgi:hypothetical protein
MTFRLEGGLENFCAMYGKIKLQIHSEYVKVYSGNISLHFSLPPISAPSTPLCKMNIIDTSLLHDIKIQLRIQKRKKEIVIKSGGFWI